MVEKATRFLESRYLFLEKPETLTRLLMNGLPDRGFTLLYRFGKTLRHACSCLFSSIFQKYEMD